MGRHRRSAAGAAADETAPVPSGGRHGRTRPSKRRVPLPVRAGLLGISAAVAVGAVAGATGMLPGGETYGLSDSSHADRADSAGAPDLLTQGTASADPTGRTAPTPASRGSERPEAPSKSASPSASPTEKTASPTPSATPSVTKTTAAPAPAKSTAAAAPAPTTAAPKTEAPEPAPDTSAQTAVLTLVNQERSKVGCSPVTLSSSLTSLAQNFSQDMAARDFFDHTDPDGDTPWDRAAAAGITNLGGENIARGQADAQAVMDSWMNSEGHRANILNCDYTTLGVGVYIADGGPWWTQDFGF
ncbi:CAP domain-containing protein [Streptomyces sp. NBC_00102]|uniref:CAP domain-containing protein n=1 Tax=Streptomyces sp. NBC_00102 TaxID=2975652 RepID=UPI00224CFF58|nr:CAP domain-containing protein [Streptomyces sp. NBC_00102]MCX5400013.1 CAP domain-containing protein [Streptomyces sp. NBC_00102]